MKTKLKEKAILLRQKGFSYAEILQNIPIAKSTLSLWLRSVNLAKSQKQRLTNKKIEAGLRGSRKRKQERIINEENIKKETREEGKNSVSTFFAMGSMLYWAEGAKSKSYRPSQGVIFSNSDPRMIRFFLEWLKLCLHIKKEQIVLEIYIHNEHSQDIDKVKTYWATITGFSLAKFDRIYYKKHNIKSNRKK